MQPFHETRTYGGGLRLVAVRSSGMEFLAHWQEDVEVFFVAEGEQRIGIQGRILALGPGQLVLLGSGEIHHYEPSAGCVGFMLIFPRDLSPDWTFPLESGLHTFRDPDRIRTIAGWMAAMADEMASRRPGYALVADGTLRLFLAALVRPDPARETEPLPDPGRTADPRMQEILDYLATHYPEPLDRDAVARRFHWSPSHFSRRFRDATNLAFSEHLARLRLEHACRALRQTRTPVSDIALDCGFDSVRTFNRAFRRHLGTCPSAIREDGTGARGDPARPFP